MRVVVVLPSSREGPIRTYAGHKCAMSVSDAFEIDLPAKGGSVDPEDDAQVICDFSPLPGEIGRRAARVLRAMAPALRGGDSNFLWSEPDPVGVGIALQVLTCLPNRRTIGKGPIYRIAFHEVVPDAGGEGIEAHGRYRRMTPGGQSVKSESRWQFWYGKQGLRSLLRGHSGRRIHNRILL